MIGQTYTALMTAQQVKDTLPEINDNIPDELIMNHQKIVTRMNIRPLLGYDYLQELQTEVSGGTISLYNQFLLDEYLYMIIALFIQQRLAISNTYQLENNGVRIKQSDVSLPTDTEEQTKYRSYIQNDIDLLQKEMVKYILANQTLFPTYISHSDPRSTNDNRRPYNYGFSVGGVGTNDECIKYGIGRRIH